MERLASRIECADVGGELADGDGLGRTAERDVIAVVDAFQLAVAEPRASAVASQGERGTVADRDQTGAEGARSDGLQRAARNIGASVIGVAGVEGRRARRVGEHNAASGKDGRRSATSAAVGGAGERTILQRAAGQCNGGGRLGGGVQIEDAAGNGQRAQSIAGVAQHNRAGAGSGDGEVAAGDQSGIGERTPASPEAIGGAIGRQGAGVVHSADCAKGSVREAGGCEVEVVARVVVRGDGAGGGRHDAVGQRGLDIGDADSEGRTKHRRATGVDRDVSIRDVEGTAVDGAGAIELHDTAAVDGDVAGSCGVVAGKDQLAAVDGGRTRVGVVAG